MEISVAIIAKNSVKTIEKTLKSLKDFDDVVVYDNGSDDGTQEIVRKYSNANLIEGEFLGFGPTKNKAASYSKYDWILSLDSDEVIDKELLNSIKTEKLNENTVYFFNRHTYYKKYRVKYCGWNNEKIKRIYNKSKTQIDNKLVHEGVIDKGLNTQELKGNVKHYSYTSISEILDKVNRYSSLYAIENSEKKVSPLKAVFSSMASFIKTYFIKKGFLDGYVGLIISYSGACVVFYKYIKLYEKNREEMEV